MTKILVIDTALRHCSVGVAELRDGAPVLLAHEEQWMARGHAEALAPMAARVMGAAKTRFDELSRIGVVIGPGGFTGVRAGLSFAQTLTISAADEAAPSLVGINSLSALAKSQAQDNQYLLAPVIDGRRGEVFAGLFDHQHTPLCAHFACTPDELEVRLASSTNGQPVQLFGNGLELLTGELPTNWQRGDADAYITVEALVTLTAAAKPNTTPVRPLYLRGADAKINSKQTIWDQQALDQSEANS